MELEDAPTTPPQTPVPAIEALDSTLGVRFDPAANRYYLVRREAALNDSLQRIKLTAPGTEGADLDIIKFAGTMDFRLDSRSLVYDAYSEIPTAFGQFLGSWGLFSLDLTDHSIRTLINFNEGLDFGNPSLAQTRDHLITFEVIERRTGLSTLFASNLQTGQTVEIGRLAAAGAIGVPGFSGDDTAVVYADAPRPAVPVAGRCAHGPHLSPRPVRQLQCPAVPVRRSWSSSQGG